MRRSLKLLAALWTVGLPAVEAAEAQDFNEPMRFIETTTQIQVFGPTRLELKRVPVIQAVGKIVPGTAKQLRLLLAQARSRGTSLSDAQIYLHSPGGDLLEGLELGQVIRANGLSTYIGSPCPAPGCFMPKGGVCASSCSLAFLGGVKRIASPVDVFGVHRFFRGTGDPEGTDMAMAQRIAAEILRYLREMGVDSRFYEMMARAGNEPLYRNRPPVTLYVMSMGEMAKLRVMTIPAPPLRTAWQYSGSSSIVARTEVASNGFAGFTDENYDLSLECNPFGVSRGIRATLSTKPSANDNFPTDVRPVVASANLVSVELMPNEYRINRESGGAVSIEMQIAEGLTDLFTGGDELTLAFGDPFTNARFGAYMFYKKFTVDLDSGKPLLSRLIALCR